jgi:hypothetical protein
MRLILQVCELDGDAVVNFTFSSKRSRVSEATFGYWVVARPAYLFAHTGYLLISESLNALMIRRFVAAAWAVASANGLYTAVHCSTVLHASLVDH